MNKIYLNTSCAQRNEQIFKRNKLALFLHLYKPIINKNSKSLLYDNEASTSLLYDNKASTSLLYDNEAWLVYYN